MKLLHFVVDKLQFEPPLRKETEARDEMVRTSLGFIYLLKSQYLQYFVVQPLAACWENIFKVHQVTLTGFFTISFYFPVLIAA